MIDAGNAHLQQVENLLEFITMAAVKILDYQRQILSFTRQMLGIPRILFWSGSADMEVRNMPVFNKIT